jgi:iron(III) transport system substrate-binding protein
MRFKRFLFRGLAVAFGAACVLAAAQVPAHYPSEYPNIVAAARHEGKVVVYAATDLSSVSALVRDFESLYAGVRVEYRELNSAELYNRFLAEVAGRRPVADVLWSPAMDLQMKLANDNHAASYKSPEAGFLPDWAVWRDVAYGTTFEPAVFVYNRRFVAAGDVPHTHAELMQLLTDKRERYLGKVTTYDINKSAVGFLFATQDARVLHGYWDLARLLGMNAVQFEPETSAMVERIASGKAYFGYNLIGSYAVARARRDPAIGVTMPSDYTLVMSRIVMLSRYAPHPNAGRLWLDYLLSARGQNLLASRAEMAAIRSDVRGELTSARLRESLGPSMRAITVGPGLLVYRDQAKQTEFLRRWRRETQDAH